MKRFLLAAAFSFIFSGVGWAQNFQEVFLDKIPALQKSLANPDSLYPKNNITQNVALGIEAAFYSENTDRYGHNIFATPNEFTTLNVKSNGSDYSLTLKSDVFEDTYPLIFDFDGDGLGEIVTVQSSLKGGGSIAIYNIKNGALNKIAQTPNIGTRNRWMNVAGIADFNGDGLFEIALVDRPHIRGELEFWTFTKEPNLVLRTSALGFSNHFIGSNAQGLSAVVKLENATFLALPSTDRKTLNLVDAMGDEIKIIATQSLPARISDNFATDRLEGVLHIGLLLNDGSAQAFRVQP